ncbi:MAG: hypothetical protein J6B95_00560 [Oscillospiraceae bacterium]|nr:hypothetical protein [Oscillospiraceae bacterium]
MRKTICLLCAVIMCLSLASPAFAAANTFVPSITYKDAPTIEDSEMNDQNTSGCLVVTSIETARKNAANATEAEKELLDVYAQLDNGTMKLPLSGDYVIRELVSVTFDQLGCIDPSHGHEEWLEEEGNCITVSFNLGVDKHTHVTVLVYKDGQWTAAEDVTNNGDGTITCTLEDIGTIAFCVEDISDAPQTGDAGFLLWVVILVMAAAAVVVLLVLRRKENKK